MTAPVMTKGAAHRCAITALAAGLSAAPPVAGADCVQVKGWSTLQDPVRLCAYLTDETAASACAARGYRLGDGLTEAEVGEAAQFLLLCADEFVIEVRRPAGETGRLLVTTAFLADDGMEGPDEGYYTSGRQRILDRTGSGWIEKPSSVTWSE